MKKIILTIQDISLGGGGERVVVNLANAFSDLGYKTQILSISFQNKKISYKLNENVELIILDTNNQLSLLVRISKKIPKNIFHIFKIFFKIYTNYKLNRVKKELFSFKWSKNDIIIDNVLQNNYFLPAIKKNKDLNIFKLIHLDYDNFYRHCKYMKDLKYYKSLILLSNKQKHLWEKSNNNIYNIANFIPFTPLKTSNLSQKVVLSAGRMDKGDQKGFLRLIDIWEIIQKDENFKEWKLHIVGDGLLKEEILHKIQAKKLEHSIILLPFNQNIEEEYLKASIYVMTSHFEGFGMVLAESASYTIPSIAFDINTGPSDIIDNKKSGFLIEDGNLQEFANKLKILMRDESLREKFGKNAKEKVQKEFSQEIIMQKWEKLINS
ncbi:MULTISPECIES: glycosyltransferase family 4 protein [Campylobacter]|uniref:glycosyltransferase family 4 protein n=1 Tax=Campylobacter TaxID=194 RepID=UPI0013EF1A55|nr:MULTISPECIES: glycosyltransferase family 4 protein [Campylobacter]HEQ3580407.1 glycosyltransferase family 4 protein [Campylobacter coli]EAI3768085.1 glycosyltransferase family 4 protein [Campylobacter jejuni]EDO8561609.1 glycosyltransferase [Campylobacter jejuni]EMB8391800.1 glycosyltransferase family 4 protein [Campylobacter jejuni]MDK2094132.1 glycosyltransferase family 4 protein [Campylobacter jejuni]